jgi:hypothetical protein
MALNVNYLNISVAVRWKNVIVINIEVLATLSGGFDGEQ